MLTFQGSAVADWYYIGHYGQLGPLTREQIDELIDGGVIARDTHVWSTGMPEWLPAGRVVELQTAFNTTQTVATPPPPPNLPRIPDPQAMPATTYASYPPPTFGQIYSPLQSDRNRVLAGILQILIPGVGRMYLGYAAYGVLQLVFTLCFGIGYLWSIIDGIIILTGGVKLDGYGRQLPD
jgi:TM2 domain-containing membrane protein YozV